MAKWGKKGKAFMERATTVSQPPSDSNWTTGGEGKEVTVKDLLSNTTTMMEALHMRMDAMEDDGKKRKVAFRGDAQATQATSGPVLRPPPGLPAPAARCEALEPPLTVRSPSLLPTTSRERPAVNPEYGLPPP